MRSANKIKLAYIAIGITVAIIIAVAVVIMNKNSQYETVDQQSPAGSSANETPQQDQDPAPPAASGETDATITLKNTPGTIESKILDELTVKMGMITYQKHGLEKITATIQPESVRVSSSEVSFIAQIEETQEYYLNRYLYELDAISVECAPGYTTKCEEHIHGVDYDDYEKNPKEPTIEVTL